MKNTIISVVGPTAIGKTKLAIKIAQHFNTEIVSADSRQFFKEMRIGTAVPTKEELQAAKHHFIQNKSIEEPYSVGDFEKEALACINNLHKQHSIVILVGGSGLYVDAVTKGFDKFPKIAPEIREKLNNTLINDGIIPLQEQLKLLDPKYYAVVDTENPHRVIRALEVCIGSGKPYSSFITDKKINRPFNIITVGITADREIIYERINQRVDIMLKEGLLEEVKSLENKKHLNALNTVGYKELFNYLNGEWTLEFAISEIKKNTRRFAKRQQTWFKKNEDTLWVDYEYDWKQLSSILEIHVKEKASK
ncbi:tRNA dimethylallyltransferase [Maribacter vaceletii]|uniref:tRNA dimethylallyltransferase n=1 Tax=Maribacter vaceletii TaxID=1206816 RepID=A0A495E9U7_9FLAO|nr:tRNA (adenosine(37)-N6)-dimethylallyltransferase MiaA [Maribacter vaceletii]RKR13379.1 tRNA dimethylallyltransferase [Maribacter vaceletii]